MSAYSVTVQQDYIGKRYRPINKLGQGGMGEVYRVYDRLTGQRMALKRVTISGEKLQFASMHVSDDFRLALAQEFKVLASLRHPNIISVQDYGFDENRQPFFTLELLEKAQTLTDYGKDIAQEQKIALIIQVLQALAYLHRRGIIHRDLKPDNVLVADHNVKVLDFGLAIARKHLQDESNVSGTLAYMAPEVLLGESHSVASDLYAVGLMAYELLVGRYPYDTLNYTQLIQSIAYQPIDVWETELNDTLKIALAKMLSHDLDERVQDAAEMIEEFARIIEQQARYETSAIRESYLQAATFVGRDKELNRLTDALIRTTDGAGSAWLIGGESGVGKTRLIDELRTQALVSGALVLSGQAISEGGAPYQILRDILRRMAIQVQLTDFEAGVLKSLVPDIDQLLERRVIPAPELDPQGAQTRLRIVIESIFQRNETPTLVLVEDIQWASESIVVLKWLTQTANDGPLMIVATFRDDEKPQLPAELSGMQFLKLYRLQEEEINDLIVSMIGDIETPQPIVQLIQRETEGNVFFIVEVMRALAEQAGQLDKIENMTLPHVVFAGGIQLAIQKRLSYVPANSRPLLEFAAVAGREIDFELLRVVAPQISLDDWLISVESVLEVQNERLRFAHDKLREGLLDALPPERRPDLHRQVAQAIETVYPDDPAQVVLLAYHWSQAGNREKERHYVALAGEQAFMNSAYNDAIEYLHRAIDLQSGDVSPQRLGELYRFLGESYMGIGQIDRGRRYLEQASALFGYPILANHSNLRLALDSLYQLFRQFMLRTGRRIGYRPKIRSAAKHKALENALTLDEPLTRAYRILNTEPLLLLNTNLRIANWAEPLYGSPQLAESTVLLGIIFGSTPLRNLAQYYIDRATEMIETIDNPYTKLVVLRGKGYYYGELGQLERSIKFSKESLEIAYEMQKWREIMEITLILSFTLYMAGEMEECVQTLDVLQTVADRIGDNQSQSYVTMGKLTINAWKADLNTLEPLNERALKVVDQDDIPLYSQLLAFQALVYWYKEDYDAAVKTVTRSLELTEKVLSPIFFVYLSLVCLVRVSFFLLEDERLSNPMFIDNARRAVKYLKKFAGLYHISVPGYKLHNATLLWHEGQYDEARQGWQEALEGARSMKMPYEEALSLVEIGRHMDANEPEREAVLTQARTLFEGFGMDWEVERINQMLAK